jgi:hypothetical protein
MATARSLQGIDWIVRTYAPTLLTACNQPGKASTLAGAQPITNTTRLNSAVTALNALEAQAKADFAATWAAAWQQALNKVDSEVVAQCPIPLSELLADTDVTVQQALKTALRGLELNAAQFVAGGGVFA